MCRAPILAVGFMILVVVPAPLVSGPRTAGERNSQVSVWISSPAAEVRPGSEVWIDVTVTNVSEHTVPCPYYRVYAWDSEGKPAPLTKQEQERLKQGPPVGGNRASFLGPGDKQESDADLRMVYDLTRPGRYTVQATAFYGKELVKSNAISITVAQAAQETPPARGQGQAFTLVISAPHYSLAKGSEFKLKVRLENCSGHQMTVDSAETRYDIQVFDSRGLPAPLTDAGRTFRKYLGSGHATFVRLKPGEILRESFNDVSKLYDLSPPGEYTIQVSRFDEQTKTWVKSNTITVTVTP
jgi:hypothetical protein